jgi:hypothetical protein
MQPSVIRKDYNWEDSEVDEILKYSNYFSKNFKIEKSAISDFKLDHIDCVDKVFMSLNKVDTNDEFFDILESAPYLSNALENPLVGAGAYLAELITRRSPRQYYIAGLGVWSDEYAFETWGEGTVPPPINLALPKEDQVIAFWDFIVERSRGGWEPIADTIQRLKDIDDLIDTTMGKFTHEL